jgi:triacylglycerol lipase
MDINFDIILKYAEMSSFAYKSNKDILTKYPKAKIFALKDTDSNCFIVTDSKTKKQYVSIRGTSSLEDAKIDLEYLKVYNKKLGIYVHEGFNKAAEEIYNSILNSLKRGYIIHCVGHSLGGALSAILMMMLHEDGFKLGQSYSYGAPKCTNKKGSQKYKDLPIIRVINMGDPVPNLPPTTIFTWANKGIFRHFGETITLLEDGYSFSGEKKSASIWFSSFWAHLFNERMKHHFMKNYIEKLEKLVK